MVGEACEIEGVATVVVAAPFFRAVVRDEIADIVVFEGNRDGDGRHRPWGEWQYGGGIAWVLRAVYCGAQEHRHIAISSILGRRARSVFECES